MFLKKFFRVKKSEDNIRIDLFLKKKLPFLSRSKIQKIIKNGYVSTKNQPILKYKKKVFENQIISLFFFKKNYSLTKNIFNYSDKTIFYYNLLKLSFVYEDKYILVLNKPPNIITVDNCKNNDVFGYRKKIDLVSLLEQFFYYKKYDDIKIVHRLDKDTSGLIIFSKNNESYYYLKKEFKNRNVLKEYVAFVFGTPKTKSGIIKKSIMRNPKNRTRMSINSKGKESITIWNVNLKLKNNFSIVYCRAITGRTHQIRLHLSSIDHPILGDSVYGGKKNRKLIKKFKFVNRTLLHSYKIGFIHPIFNKPFKFFIPPPKDFLYTVKKFF
jgi:23S rRNA pseudouridine1911/1915/1917 synthase